MEQKAVLAQYRLYAATERHNTRVDFARACIEKAFELSGSNRWALSLSFGKDSMALYYLLKEYIPDLHCFFLASSESFALHNFAEVMETMEALQVTVIQTEHANNGEGWVESRKEGVDDRWLLDKQAAEMGYVGSFIGLRREESKKRSMALATGYGGRAAYYTTHIKDPKAHGLWHSCPLAEWTLQDVGAWLWRHDAPLLDSYLAEGLKTRTTARATGISVNFGNVPAYLKARNPAAYNRIIQIFPELAQK
jgi:3'-phosphoadenosine 5'-phosphosulfate sulfotransferase (PAPS reductase)/FAD synthetase